MITLERAAYQNKMRNSEFHGLSTDEKPLVYSNGNPIDNGTIFYEIDTGDEYRFDKENGEWVLQSGGGSSVTVEPISVTENGTYTAPSGKAYSPVSVNVTQGEPIEISTSDGMSTVLTSANVGKAYLYTGETDDTYTNGDIYVVEESV